MEYSSNISPIVFRLNEKLSKLKNSDVLQREIANYLFKENWERISLGKDVDDVQIGVYNFHNEIYINPKKMGLKKDITLLGKPVEKSLHPQKIGKGEDIIRARKTNGRKHVTRWYPSYFAFRRDIGLESQFVNLQLTKKLFKDWLILPDGKDWVIGFQTKYGSDVSRGNETRFNKTIFGISKSAQKKITEQCNEFVKESLK